MSRRALAYPAQLPTEEPSVHVNDPGTYRAPQTPCGRWRNCPTPACGKRVYFGTAPMCPDCQAKACGWCSIGLGDVFCCEECEDASREANEQRERENAQADRSDPGPDDPRFDLERDER